MASMKVVEKNWILNRYTIEFIGTWELIHNPNFKVVEFDHFKMSADLPSFVLSAYESPYYADYQHRFIEKNTGKVQILRGKGTKVFPCVSFVFSGS